MTVAIYLCSSFDFYLLVNLTRNLIQCRMCTQLGSPWASVPTIAGTPFTTAGGYSVCCVVWTGKDVDFQ